jgi:hypothetical protein
MSGVAPRGWRQFAPLSVCDGDLNSQMARVSRKQEFRRARAFLIAQVAFAERLSRGEDRRYGRAQIVRHRPQQCGPFTETP